MHIYQAQMTSPFAIKSCAIDICFILTLYGIFGGMPRYCEIIESMGLGGSTIPHILHIAAFLYK